MLRTLRRTLRKQHESARKRALPEQAITLQLRVSSSRKLTPQDMQEARHVMQHFGFPTVYLIHGNALSINGKTVLVSGPPGIGKSTIARKLEREKKATVIEESNMLVGEKEGKWFLVETGTKNLNQVYSKATKAIVKTTLTSESSYHKENASVSKPKQLFYRWFVRPIAGKVAIALTKRPKDPFEPQIHEVQRIVFARHQNDPYPPIKINSDLTIEQTQNVHDIAPKQIPLTIFSTVGSQKSFYAKLERLLLKE